MPFLSPESDGREGQTREGIRQFQFIQYCCKPLSDAADLGAIARWDQADVCAKMPCKMAPSRGVTLGASARLPEAADARLKVLPKSPKSNLVIVIN